MTTDFVSTAFIVHNDRVLLCHHKKIETWLPVGGHLEENEDPEQALFREVQEETGLEVRLKDQEKPLQTSSLVPNYIDTHPITADHQHVSFTYFAAADTDKLAVQEAELNDLRWFSMADLNNPEYKLRESVVIYAKKALEYWS
jgi:ADP-ribose pyrophosphatase YjhB (NUDIX family)